MGWIIVAAFAVTFVVAILGITGKLRIERAFLNWLFYSMIAEIVSAGFFIFYEFHNPVPPLPLLDETVLLEYICAAHTSSGQTEYEHGGTATIKLYRTPHGIRFQIKGRRDWKHQGSQRWEFDPPFCWNSDWGCVSDENEIRFTYSVTTGDGTINGYAHGQLKVDSKGRPQFIEGSFWQLSPTMPLKGGMTFRRMKDSADRKWNKKGSSEYVSQAR